MSTYQTLRFAAKFLGDSLMLYTRSAAQNGFLEGGMSILLMVFDMSPITSKMLVPLEPPSNHSFLILAPR